MIDVTANWNAAPLPLGAQSTITAYIVRWSYNGTMVIASSVSRSSAQDVTGYNADFALANPSIALKAGDVVSVIVNAFDQPNTLLSSPGAIASVTIPPAPPAPPAAPLDPTGLNLHIVSS